MPRPYYKRLVGVALAGIVSACASIMGVEEPRALGPIGLEDGGATGEVDAGAAEGSTSASAACVVGGVDTCPPGSYCLATGECATGCKADAECSDISTLTPYCELSRHQCVACRGDGDCGGDKKCSPSGACADRCSAGSAGACPDGKVCCGELCIDVASDPFNCNGCGNACKGGSPLCCNGQCKDALIDKDNCGACGLKCSSVNADPTCNAGACKWACALGYSHCTPGNTGCETATSSVAMCGGCDVSCTTKVKNASGVVCTGSACDYGACNAGYVDLDSDRANGCEAACGGLNQPCCPGATRCQGTAYCAATQMCLACKPQGSSCNGGIAGECCGGKVCQPSMQCQ